MTKSKIETEIEFEVENNLMAKTVTFFEKIFYLEVPPAQLVLYQFILILIHKNPKNTFTEEYLGRYMGKDIRTIRRYLVDLQDKGLIKIIYRKNDEGRYAPNRYRILDVDLIPQSFSDGDLLNPDFKLDYSTKSKDIRRKQKEKNSPEDTSVQTEIRGFQGLHKLDVTSGHECPTEGNQPSMDRTPVSPGDSGHQCPHSTSIVCSDPDCTGNLDADEEKLKDTISDGVDSQEKSNPKLDEVLTKYQLNIATPTAKILLDICAIEKSQPEDLDRALFVYFKFKEEGGVIKKSPIAFVRSLLQEYQKERNFILPSTPDHVKKALNKKRIRVSSNHILIPTGEPDKPPTEKYENFYL